MCRRFGQDVGSESLYGGSVLPGIRRETSFLAGLLKQAHAVPMVRLGDLGQQQTPVKAAADKKPVHPRDDLVGGDEKKRGQDGYFDFDAGNLLGRDRREAGILESCCAGHVGDDDAQRQVRSSVADAAAQVAPGVQRDEGAAPLLECVPVGGGEVQRGIGRMERLAAGGSRKGLAGEGQQPGAARLTER